MLRCYLSSNSKPINLIDILQLKAVWINFSNLLVILYQWPFSRLTEKKSKQDALDNMNKGICLQTDYQSNSF